MRKLICHNFVIKQESPTQYIGEAQNDIKKG